MSACCLVRHGQMFGGFLEAQASREPSSQFCLLGRKTVQLANQSAAQGLRMRIGSQHCNRLRRHREELRDCFEKWADYNLVVAAKRRAWNQDRRGAIERLTGRSRGPDSVTKPRVRLGIRGK